MNILSTQYTLATKSFEIYVAGCKGQPHCQNCQNPESWNFNQGYEYKSYFNKTIAQKLIDFDNMINNIMIFGGEPLDQPYAELHDLLMTLENYNKKIWLFTRFDIEDVPHLIKQGCDYIKCGRYIEELTTDDNMQHGIKLATSNQKIYAKGIDY